MSNLKRILKGKEAFYIDDTRYTLENVERILEDSEEFESISSKIKNLLSSRVSSCKSLNSQFVNANLYSFEFMDLNNLDEYLKKEVILLARAEFMPLLNNYGISLIKSKLVSDQLSSAILKEFFDHGILYDILSKREVLSLRIEKGVISYIEKNVNNDLNSKKEVDRIFSNEEIEKLLFKLFKKDILGNSLTVDTFIQNLDCEVNIINRNLINKYNDTHLINIKKIDRSLILDDWKLTDDMKEFFNKIVKGKKNIVIVGQEGSGKSAFLSLLSRLIPENEFVIALQKLQTMPLINAVNLKFDFSFYKSMQYKKEFQLEKSEFERDMSHLFIAALKQHPDRILVDTMDSIVKDVLLSDTKSISILNAINATHALHLLNYLLLESKVSEVIIPKLIQKINYIISLGKLETEVDTKGYRILEIIEINQEENSDKESSLFNLFPENRINRKSFKPKLNDIQLGKTILRWDKESYESFN